MSKNDNVSLILANKRLDELKSLIDEETEIMANSGVLLSVFLKERAILHEFIESLNQE